MKIAVDAMGGDIGPDVTVKGAIDAVSLGAEVILVGDQKSIEDRLKTYGASTGQGLEVVHASEVVLMDESPAHAIRKKKDSSIRVCFDLVRAGRASGVVSAGNSGAIMAAGIFVLKRLKGIDRPAIAVPLPTTKDPAIVLDAGGNVDCKPINLVQFAIMGDVYARYALKKENPRIGLLSNASEESKGNELTRLTHDILKKTSLNYVGYLEGRDIFKGDIDVVVTDGFVGNIVLKLSEGVVDGVIKMLKSEIESSVLAKIGYLFMKGAFRNLKNKLDYAEYGGAPLLGVDGACIISHGGSPAKAIKNAVFRARELVSGSVSSHLGEEVERNDEFERLAINSLK
ncbi:MAG: phosphate acyltransferase PlsX [Deltaproteobacteria bacterium]|nr:phosphate acyltransferase PlsX [Deltaproteobacteria bacterium]